MLLLPFLGQELHDFVPALRKGGAVAPDGVGGVCESNLGRVAGVPEVLSGLDLLERGVGSEWWDDRRHGRRWIGLAACTERSTYTYATGFVMRTRSVTVPYYVCRPS